MQRADFLVEIQTEELPPPSLRLLSESFRDNLVKQFKQAGLSFRLAHCFATPRRLAVLVERLAGRQADTTAERRGPARKAAFDAAGHPTLACLGFARSCGIAPEELLTLKEGASEWVGYRETVVGKTAQELIPPAVSAALAALPISRRMRWGDHDTAFVRPVQRVILLYGREVIPDDILGCTADRYTAGHRFHAPKPLAIHVPARYRRSLEKNYVLPDFDARRTAIHEMAQTAAVAAGGRAVIDEVLLDEVTGLVEWPVAITGHFPEKFLGIPREILVSAMQDHQRYFPVVNSAGKLLPHFIAIANIESRNPGRVIAGNERVLRARLADAAFFYETDKKIPLAKRLEQLRGVVFHAGLGSLYDKSQRVANLAVLIAEETDADPLVARRAGELARCDLVTEVVGEFPRLQGIMGQYYARHDGEKPAVAKAIAEQYRPRFSGDALPETPAGCALALADRLDTLAGLFGTGNTPSGEKDPLGMRRAALGIVRLITEKEMPVRLDALFGQAVQLYGETLPAETARIALAFVLDRLKPWYQDQEVPVDVVAAVLALGLVSPLDIHRRILAVQQFGQLPEAASLSIANKRVSNILARANQSGQNFVMNPALFEEEAEHRLADALASRQKIIQTLSGAGKYAEALQELAGLREPVDHFFETVRVMTEDMPRRNNRLQLLHELRTLFLQVADIALLR